MTAISVLEAIVKLPRHVRIRATNGIDENNAVVIQEDKEKERHDKQLAYKRKHYEKNKQKRKEYDKRRYSEKREAILAQKRIYNDRPEVKERSRRYHKKYYLDHKEELNRKSRENHRRNKNNGDKVPRPQLQQNDI